MKGERRIAIRKIEHVVEMMKGNMVMKQYVVGFVFDKEIENVLTLKRNKPPYQNLHNGVGGKIEAGEDRYTAMLRELEEETGLTEDDIQKWDYLTTMHFPSGIVLNVFYFLLVDGKRSGIHTNAGDEGVLEWLNIEENHLLDASNPILAGDGNIAYFIQFTRNLEKTTW